jgi:hypothetical protein
LNSIIDTIFSEVEEPTETDPESRARSMAREHIAQEKDLQEKYHDAASFLIGYVGHVLNTFFRSFPYWRRQ